MKAGWTAAAAFGLAIFAAREARAAQGAVWWVETTCEAARPTFEREVTLACEAVGGTCRVATQRSEAELVARLECPTPSSGWILDTQTVSGQPLGHLELTGPDDDRLREAAMEVARDAAPERTLAVEALASNLSDGDGVPKAPAPPTLSLAASGLVAIRPSATMSSVLGGGRALAGLNLHEGFREIASVSIAAAGADHALDAVRVLRVGAGIAMGAPFSSSPSWIGNAIEAGFEREQHYERWSESVAAPGAANALAPSGLVVSALEDAAYVQDTVIFQLPTRGFRPFAALTASLTTTARFTADAQLGVALPVF